MARPNEPTVKVMVESYKAEHTSGMHGDIHVRPVDGQGYPTNINVRCPREMKQNYPVGTRFWIQAKLTDREGGTDFLSTHHSWPWDVVDKG
jgi:hypothetical protein